MGRYLNSSTSYVLYKGQTEQPYFVDKSQMLSELFPFCNYSFISMILDYFITLPILRQSKSHCRLETILIKMLNGNDFFI